MPVQAPGFVAVGHRASVHAGMFRSAVERGDGVDAVALALLDAREGADVLDVCFAGHPDERRRLPAFVRSLRQATELPVMLDSRDPVALRLGLEALDGDAIVNSVHLADPALLDGLRPLLPDARGVVALALEPGPPATSAAGRLRAAERALDALAGAGVAEERIWLDAVALPAAVGTPGSAHATLDALAAARERWPRVTTLLGAANVGWGLTGAARQAVEAVFLDAALERGLQAAFALPWLAAITQRLAAAVAEAARDVVFGAESDERRSAALARLHSLA